MVISTHSSRLTSSGSRVENATTLELLKIGLNPSMEISFSALPSKQGPVQGRFKPTHLLISLNHGRTESKKISPCSVPRFSL
jgi:hypothetical protein